MAEVSVMEMKNALKKGNSGTAPGPDGLTLSILKQVPEKFLKCRGDTFTSCLRENVFPTMWKRARLVLIPKEEPGDVERKIKARPILFIITYILFTY